MAITISDSYGCQHLFQRFVHIVQIPQNILKMKTDFYAYLRYGLALLML